MVAGLAERVLAVDGNGPHRPTVEMRLETLEVGRAEDDLRSVLGNRPVAMAHATRLLPHEMDAVAADGVVPLNLGHRSHRLDEIIGRYGSEPGAPDFEPLRSAGRLTDKGQHPGRIGAIWAGLHLLRPTTTPSMASPRSSTPGAARPSPGHPASTRRWRQRWTG